ncbi:MAG: pyridoxal phosphate-dependent aminotransferase [Gammaproteobacteria bacterium]|nr:pyridoxal phosphate-dependent aminotransferase [Gammaproteobacteria bacterium]
MPKAAHRMMRIAEPVIPVINRLAARRAGTISLGQGVVFYPPPPAALQRAAAQMNDAGRHFYGPVEGIAALREAIGGKLARCNGITVGGGTSVFVTAGANMAFNALVLAVCDPGDEVILPAPYYFNHQMTVEMCGCRAVVVETGERHHPVVERIEAAITPRTRAVVTVSPNNPTGRVYPQALLTAVNRLCARRGVYHISDEAYEDFTYEDHRHFSPGALPGAGAHTLSLFTLSKSYGMASWRVGYMVIPDSLHDAMTKVQDNILICTPTISQLAAVQCLDGERDYLREQRSLIETNRALCLERLGALSEEGLVEPPSAEGALYIFLKMKRRCDDYRLAETLVREHGVAVIPGSAFGPCDGACLRISYGALPPAAIGEGVGRLVGGLRECLRGQKPE